MSNKLDILYNIFFQCGWLFGDASHLLLLQRLCVEYIPSYRWRWVTINPKDVAGTIWSSKSHRNFNSTLHPGITWTACHTPTFYFKIMFRRRIPIRSNIMWIYSSTGLPKNAGIPTPFQDTPNRFICIKNFTYSPAADASQLKVSYSPAADASQLKVFTAFPNLFDKKLEFPRWSSYRSSLCGIPKFVLGRTTMMKYQWLGCFYIFRQSHTDLPSGKLTVRYGKWPFLMGKSTISMAIFNSKRLVHQRVCPGDWSNRGGHRAKISTSGDTFESPFRRVSEGVSHPLWPFDGNANDVC